MINLISNVERLCDMPNHDSAVFHLAQDPFPMSTAGRRLPCWCRGRERAPLKSLPIFQFLEAQYEANGLGALVTPASATRGLGRGKPLGHTAHVGGSSSSSDTDDDINVVENFNKRRRPLTLPALSQNPDSSSCAKTGAPRARLPDPKLKEAKLSENPRNIKRCIESGWKKRITQMVKHAVQSNAKTRGPQFQGKKTTSLPARVPAKKPSFDPAEFTQADSLEWGASWANARDRGQNSESSEEDDGAELSDEECATAAEKRALAQELHDAMESDTPEGSLSSLSESLAGEAVSEGCPPPRSFRVANLPGSAPEERICEILAPFSEACSVAPTPGSGGH